MNKYQKYTVNMRHRRDEGCVSIIVTAISPEDARLRVQHSWPEYEIVHVSIRENKNVK